MVYRTQEYDTDMGYNGSIGYVTENGDHHWAYFSNRKGYIMIGEERFITAIITQAVEDASYQGTQVRSI